MRNLAIRNSVLGGSGSALPYDAEVEYLEGTGKEWINTGVDAAICNNEIATIKCIFSITGTGGPGGSYNGIWGAVAPRFGIYGIDRNLCWGYYNAYDNVKNIEYGDWINSECVFTKSNQIVRFGDDTFSASGKSNLSSMHIGLFCRYHNTTPQWISLAKINSYSFSSETKNQFMIPVRFTNENGISEGAMYDRISGQLFRNAGTGAFIIGPDKQTFTANLGVLAPLKEQEA